mmetsp:Transcript_55511/g.127638  ORF Transcript_55511/g.127638 Transcript_55511/m.127638 type:complete len:246 (+) Transcript_55511:120-857(+)
MGIRRKGERASDNTAAAGDAAPPQAGVTVRASGSSPQKSPLPLAPTPPHLQPHTLSRRSCNGRTTVPPRFELAWASHETHPPADGAPQPPASQGGPAARPPNTTSSALRPPRSPPPRSSPPPRAAHAYGWMRQVTQTAHGLCRGWSTGRRTQGWLLAGWLLGGWLLGGWKPGGHLPRGAKQADPNWWPQPAQHQAHSQPLRPRHWPQSARRRVGLVPPRASPLGTRANPDRRLARSGPGQPRARS